MTDERTTTHTDSDLYKRLIESVRDYAIIALDESGNIRSWNPGAQRLHQFAAQEIIGRRFSTLFATDEVTAGRPNALLDTAARGGRSEDEIWMLRRDGSSFCGHVVVTALRNDAAVLTGYAMIARDLTERRAPHDQALADMRQAAESMTANRAKSDFLMAMSHELRTPLNAIGGYAELLSLGLGGAVTDRQREYLERIRKSQQHLMALINDILNFSRVEGGQIAYDLVEVSLSSVIDAVVPMIEPQATAKHLRVTRQSGPDTLACADRSKVEQILINLLSNAVKYTDAGGQIGLTHGEVNRHVEIRVRDTGIGIPADKITVIFEPFVQVGRSLTRLNEGTGLGLSISRDLARAMGGDLTAESVVGEGATFVLTLPAG
jgi:PAS domain S-box-containing protein